MRIKRARQLHAGEWVAMRVTRTSAADVPLEGDVVAHAVDRRALHDIVRRFRVNNPKARIFIFFAGDPIPKGLAVSLACR